MAARRRIVQTADLSAPNTTLMITCWLCPKPGQPITVPDTKLSTVCSKLPRFQETSAINHGQSYFRPSCSAKTVDMCAQHHVIFYELECLFLSVQLNSCDTRASLRVQYL